MVDPHVGLAVAFNGCIYNHRELRRELEAKGRRFFTGHDGGDGSDTEVILHAYAEWGDSFVERLHGMFAIAIAERDSGRVFLARDQLGIKPPYLSEAAGSLRFAQPLPALPAGAGTDPSIHPNRLHPPLPSPSLRPP